ncbi:MAG: squalene/phytoene synthase family protein [Solirubrobacteraceae bacterium]
MSTHPPIAPPSSVHPRDAVDAASQAAGRTPGAADGSTFAPSLALLPRAARADVECFYGVLRTIDDLVDEDDPDAAGRVAALERWAGGGAPGDGSGSPEARALEQLDARRPLPRARLLDFCAGMRHDLRRAAIETDRDFDRYCHQAGGSVGIVLAHLLGADGIDPGGAGAAQPLREVEWRMEALGRAMQVTNIARDIDEDLAQGRLYVPASMIERHGFPAPGAREDLLRELIARADALYEQGERAIPLLRDGRRAMALAAALYREILRQIERDGLGRSPGRAVVPAWRTQELIARHRSAPSGGAAAQIAKGARASPPKTV